MGDVRLPGMLNLWKTIMPVQVRDLCMIFDAISQYVFGERVRHMLADYD